MNYNRLLEGKRVFITAGQRGIGKDIAVVFAKHGASIALGGRQQDELDKVIAELNAINPGAKGYLLDLSCKNETESACDQIITDFGGIDVLVYTVGVSASPCP